MPQYQPNPSQVVLQNFFSEGAIFIGPALIIWMLYIVATNPDITQLPQIVLSLVIVLVFTFLIFWIYTYYKSKRILIHISPHKITFSGPPKEVSLTFTKIKQIKVRTTHITFKQTNQLQMPDKLWKDEELTIAQKFYIIVRPPGYQDWYTEYWLEINTDNKQEIIPLGHYDQSTREKIIKHLKQYSPIETPTFHTTP